MASRPSVRRPPRALLAGLLLLGLPAPAPAQTPDGEVAARIERVERGILPGVRIRGRETPPSTIEERLRLYGVPAVSVAVIHDGRIEWARAWGLADVESGRRATPETLFQAASMSKPVAATAALRLVEAGALELDADVNRKLTSWKVPENALTARSPVTLRRLLTHSAGLTVHGFPGYAPGTPLPSVVQILDGAGPANTDPVRVDVEPGSAWRYSGGGTTVLQLLLTDVTGERFPELMRRSVLEPLEMRSSTYEQPLPPERAAEAATAYRAGGTRVEGGHHVYPEMAAAGLWTTPSDLARWILGIQGALAGRPGSLLSRETAEAMLTPGVGGWGLGPSLEGEGDSRRFSHGGANEGFRGMLVGFARQGEGMVVMTNSDRGGPLATEVAQAVAREYGWEGIAPREIVPVALPPAVLAALAGRYAGDGMEIALRVEGGLVLLREPDGDEVELVPTGESALAIATSAAPVSVERDPSGRVIALVVAGTRFERLP